MPFHFARFSKALSGLKSINHGEGGDDGKIINVHTFPNGIAELCCHFLTSLLVANAAYSSVLFQVRAHSLCLTGWHECLTFPLGSDLANLIDP